MQTERLGTDDEGLVRAAELLRSGELVAFPTETVYGLGGLASDSEAVGKIFAAKGRPADRPVIVHLGSIDQLGSWASGLAPNALRLAESFWPGPLTLILPHHGSVLDAVTGGRDTVGVRVPAHWVARRLLELVGDGVAAPSANRYGHVSPTTADHVLADLDGRIAAVVDGGPCNVGLESTIVEIVQSSPGAEPRVSVLRHGGVPVSAIEGALGRSVIDGSAGTGEEARAPGMVLGHYAPAAPLAVVTAEQAGTAPTDVAVIEATAGEDDRDFAAALYARLRAVDQTNPREIWVVPPVSGELLPAILDRLSRASHR